MIADAIKQAQTLARKALEETYDGRCTVVQHRKVKDKNTKITAEADVVVAEDIPCKLSYSNISAVDQTEASAKTAQVTKLFLSPDVMIMPGSKITVLQSSVTRDYEASGVPAVYPTHQEIVVKLSERYA